MIVQCEKCDSRFNLDEALIKEEGSKVRCSQCRHVFVVRPPQEEPSEPESPPTLEDAPEETVVLDAPPSPGAGVPADEDLEIDAEMEERWTDLEPPEGTEAISPEDLPDLEEAPPDLEDAFERASEIEERVTREDTEGKEQEGEAGEKAEVPVRARRGRRSLLIPLVVGGLLLIGVLVAAVVLAPGMIPDSLSFLKQTEEPASVDPGVKRLSFADVKGRFVQTEDGKQRFVVQGSIVNNYPGPRSFIRVKASILDEKGGSLRSREAYAGNPFSQGELKGRPLTFLEKTMKRRAGKEKQNVSIPTGSQVPFMVVFQDLPENISEFTVEAVASLPGERS